MDGSAFHCKLCVADLDLGQLLQGLGCDCMLCSPCVKSSVVSALSAARPDAATGWAARISCPACSTLVPLSVVRQLAPAEYAAFEDASMASMLDSQGCIRCPYPSCKAWIELVGAAAEAAAEAASPPGLQEEPDPGISGVSPQQARALLASSVQAPGRASPDKRLQLPSVQAQQAVRADPEIIDLDAEDAKAEETGEALDAFLSVAQRKRQAKKLSIDLTDVSPTGSEDTFTALQPQRRRLRARRCNATAGRSGGGHDVGDKAGGGAGASGSMSRADGSGEARAEAHASGLHNMLAALADAPRATAAASAEDDKAGLPRRPVTGPAEPLVAGSRAARQIAFKEEPGEVMPDEVIPDDVKPAAAPQRRASRKAAHAGADVLDLTLDDGGSDSVEGGAEQKPGVLMRRRLRALRGVAADKLAGQANAAQAAGSAADSGPAAVAAQLVAKLRVLQARAGVDLPAPPAPFARRRSELQGVAAERLQRNKVLAALQALAPAPVGAAAALHVPAPAVVAGAPAPAPGKIKIARTAAKAAAMLKTKMEAELAEHFKRCRIRCALCGGDFCRGCQARPFHKGQTCEQFHAPSCLYCDTKVLPKDVHTPNRIAALNPLRTKAEALGLDLVADASGRLRSKPELVDLLLHAEKICDGEACAVKRAEACFRRLPCGHLCCGVRGELHCLPCLDSNCAAATAEAAERTADAVRQAAAVAAGAAQAADALTDTVSGHEAGPSTSAAAPAAHPVRPAVAAQSGEDDCFFCWERLSTGPCIQLGCQHICHVACARQRLEVAYPGPSISFTFLNCPLCGPGPPAPATLSHIDESQASTSSAATCACTPTTAMVTLLEDFKAARAVAAAAAEAARPPRPPPPDHHRRHQPYPAYQRHALDAALAELHAAVAGPVVVPPLQNRPERIARPARRRQVAAVAAAKAVAGANAAPGAAGDAGPAIVAPAVVAPIAAPPPFAVAVAAAAAVAAKPARRGAAARAKKVAFKEPAAAAAAPAAAAQDAHAPLLQQLVERLDIMRDVNAPAALKVQGGRMRAPIEPRPQPPVAARPGRAAAAVGAACAAAGVGAPIAVQLAAQAAQLAALVADLDGRRGQRRIVEPLDVMNIPRWPVAGHQLRQAQPAVPDKKGKADGPALIAASAAAAAAAEDAALRLAGPPPVFYMDHPALHGLMKKALLLRQRVVMLSVNRIVDEGLISTEDALKPGGEYHERLADYGLAKFLFFECSRCNKPYYGGKKACGAGPGGVPGAGPGGGGGGGGANGERAYDKNDLMCGDCSARLHGEDCPAHGTTFIEFKCKYCCDVASWFCWGTTHFCDPCHSRTSGLRVTPCPGVARCPLKMPHPANPSEFCLGCGMCRRSNTT